MGHDQWIRFLSSLLGPTLSINEVLIRYRQHEKSVGGSGRQLTESKQKTIVELARTLVDKNFKKKKRQELITFLERRVATASGRGIIAQKIATRVRAESAGQALSRVESYRDYTQYQAARLSVYQSTHRGQS